MNTIAEQWNIEMTVLQCSWYEKGPYSVHAVHLGKWIQCVGGFIDGCVGDLLNVIQTCVPSSRDSVTSSFVNPRVLATVLIKYSWRKSIIDLFASRSSLAFCWRKTMFFQLLKLILLLSDDYFFMLPSCMCIIVVQIFYRKIHVWSNLGQNLKKKKTCHNQTFV